MGLALAATIKQFLEDVCWGELDYLIIDTPPGTSDEHITVCEQLLGFEPDGAIMVTTPQKVALMDVRREISFCRKLGLPIIGLLENMSGFVCPTCSVCRAQRSHMIDDITRSLARSLPAVGMLERLLQGRRREAGSSELGAIPWPYSDRSAAVCVRRGGPQLLRALPGLAVARGHLGLCAPHDRDERCG